MITRTILTELLRDERGATAVEYGLLIGLLFIALVAAANGFGNSAIEMWGNVKDKVEAVRRP